MKIKQILCFGKKEKRLEEMSKKEKKDFLSNDMIERMIRIEQRVSSQFGKFLKYNETAYYKSLSGCEKERFEKYLREKGKVKTIMSLILLVPVFVLFLVNVSFTGNVISENFGGSNYFDYLLLGLIGVLLTGILFYYINKKSRRKKFNRHFEVIENIYRRKRYLK